MTSTFSGCHVGAAGAAGSSRGSAGCCRIDLLHADRGHGLDADDSGVAVVGLEDGALAVDTDHEAGHPGPAHERVHLHASVLGVAQRPVPTVRMVELLCMASPMVHVH